MLFENKKSQPIESSTLAKEDEDEEMVVAGGESESQGPLSFAKMMVNGQYTYLTYMLLSATSFFFWLMPNAHLFKRFTNWQAAPQINSQRYSSKKASSGSKRSMLQKSVV